MKTLSLILCVVSFALTSCSSDQAASHSHRQTVVSLSLSDAQEMLSTNLTRAEVERRLGPPIGQTAGNWGNLMYELPGKKYLFFWFKGPYITEACFDKTEIKGIQPKTYQMSFVFNFEKQKHFFSLDGKVFEDIESFKSHLIKLPRNTIVEWQHPCSSFTEVKEPIRTPEQIKSFEEFCLEHGIILIQYLAG